MGLKLSFSNSDNQAEKQKNFPSSDGKRIVEDISNWYSDRYGKILIQRNLLIIILLITLIVVIVASINLGMIAMSNKIAPIIVEIEEKTGIPTLVNPLSSQGVELSTNQALNEYFVIRYIRSREAYCDVSYNYDYYTVVRVLSSGGVYSAFKKFINSDPNSPLVKFGNGVCNKFELRSIQFLNKTNGSTNVVVRYNIVTSGGKIPRIATLNFQYFQTNMSYNDRLENPLGFTVVSYNSVDEVNVELQ
jgi:type IV secretion system protein VirB8